MLWAACCLGFLATCARVSLSPQWRENLILVSILHSRMSQLTMRPTLECCRFGQSKTDPFRQGITIVLGRTDSQLCPVAALLACLVLHGPGEGPLFHYEDRRPMTKTAVSDSTA